MCKVLSAVFLLLEPSFPEVFTQIIKFFFFFLREKYYAGSANPGMETLRVYRAALGTYMV
jgi:hypothetical protein